MDEDVREAQVRRPRGRPRLDEQFVPRILDAAERLFAEQGPVSVTIRDIAAEAGLPHSNIYRYFENKDEILRQVLARGRERQARHEQQGREAGRSTEGALDWIIRNNRAYALVLMRLALMGETTSSLGIDPGVNLARRSLQVLESGFPFDLRTDHDPRMVIAAVMALTLGYVVAEDWIIDAVGMHGCDPEEVRAALDGIMASMMALGKGPSDTCGDALGA